MLSIQELNKKKRSYEKILHDIDSNFFVFSKKEVDLINEAVGAPLAYDETDLIDLDENQLNDIRLHLIREIVSLKKAIHEYHKCERMESKGKDVNAYLYDSSFHDIIDYYNRKYLSNKRFAYHTEEGDD